LSSQDKANVQSITHVGTAGSRRGGLNGA